MPGYCERHPSYHRIRRAHLYRLSRGADGSNEDAARTIGR
jgi:hypothetical protein